METNHTKAKIIYIGWIREIPKFCSHFCHFRSKLQLRLEHGNFEISRNSGYVDIDR